jgi:hypothetical protein
MQTFYTTSQALPILGNQRLCLYDNIKKGRLKATLSLVNGKATYLINHDDLMAFIAARDAKKQSPKH